MAAEAMGNVIKLGDDGDEAKKSPSVVVVEEIQKVDESTTLQLPVAKVSLQRWCFPKGRRGKIIFWLHVIGFAIMLLILILYNNIFLRFNPVVT